MVGTGPSVLIKEVPYSQMWLCRTHFCVAVLIREVSLFEGSFVHTSVARIAGTALIREVSALKGSTALVCQVFVSMSPFCSVAMAMR